MEPARLNPFRTECTERLAFRFAEGWGRERLFRELAVLGWRGAIVGPHGSGKTTLLEELAAYLREIGQQVELVRFNAESSFAVRRMVCRRLGRLSSDAVVLLDGAEQVPWWEWLWWRWRTRRLAGLVITTHGSGRLRCVYHCATSIGLLEELVTELSPGADRERNGQFIKNVFAGTQGNLRLALWKFYDRYARAGG